ncbi:MAG: hypothetical protein GF400_02380 [Candidatus Eisenbacteria bacterium]|nr:hypothetical protein [Candidatus Eisenbacteria bacterium]
MGRADTRPHERTVYRIVVGCANLALAAMLTYGTFRYFQLIVPEYGHRFTFLALIMLGLAGWMVVRGFMVFFGRRRDGRR